MATFGILPLVGILVLTQQNVDPTVTMSGTGTTVVEFVTGESYTLDGRATATGWADFDGDGVDDFWVTLAPWGRLTAFDVSSSRAYQLMNGFDTLDGDEGAAHCQRAYLALTARGAILSAELIQSWAQESPLPLHVTSKGIPDQLGVVEAVVARQHVELARRLHDAERSTDSRNALNTALALREASTNLLCWTPQ